MINLWLKNLKKFLFFVGMNDASCVVYSVLNVSQGKQSTLSINLSNLWLKKETIEHHHLNAFIELKLKWKSTDVRFMHHKFGSIAKFKSTDRQTDKVASKQLQ